MMERIGMIEAIDERYNVIDAEPSNDKRDAYLRIAEYYSNLSGVTVYPVRDEKGKQHYFIVQSKLLSGQDGKS